MVTGNQHVGGICSSESMNNTVIMAIDAGKKVKTKAERIKEAKATIEALKANYPDEYANLVSEMDIDESELTE